MSKKELTVEAVIRKWIYLEEKRMQAEARKVSRPSAEKEKAAA